MQLIRRRAAFAAALAVIAPCVVPARSRAESPATPDRASVDARSGLYQDTDHTTISTTTVAGRATIARRVTLEARYLVDVVSSASVDVVSAATQTIHDVRHEAAGAATFHDGTRTASLSYVYSVENDWESHTAAASASHDLAQHNVRLSAGASFVWNAVGRSGDANFHRRLLVGGGGASVTLTPSPRDLVQIGYTLSYLDGYQASPYRFVRAFERTGAAPSPVGYPETVPDTRSRHSLTARWNHHLFKDTALKVHVRAYADDWGLVSATAGADYAVGFGPVETALQIRGYAQGPAAFYRAEYQAPLRYMTADRELATFVDAFFGGRVGYRKRLGRLEELRAEARVDGFAFEFFDFPRLRTRFGVVAELALGISL